MCFKKIKRSYGVSQLVVQLSNVLASVQFSRNSPQIFNFDIFFYRWAVTDVLWTIYIMVYKHLIVSASMYTQLNSLWPTLYTFFDLRFPTLYFLYTNLIKVPDTIYYYQKESVHHYVY